MFARGGRDRHEEIADLQQLVHCAAAAHERLLPARLRVTAMAPALAAALRNIVRLSYILRLTDDACVQVAPLYPQPHTAYAWCGPLANTMGEGFTREAAVRES